MSFSNVSHFDDLLNLELLHNWTLQKHITDQDVNNIRQLILPAVKVEGYIIPALPADQRKKLSKRGGRIVIDVYDVDRSIRYNMELVKPKNGDGYRLEEWDQVSLPRNIQAGTRIGMFWKNGLLQFKIFPNQ